MTLNKNNCYTNILIALISIMISLTFVCASIESEAVKKCQNDMNVFCGVENPSTNDCVKNAYRMWEGHYSIDYLDVYYQYLHQRVNYETVLQPYVFCRQKDDYEECMANLQKFWSILKPVTKNEDVDNEKSQGIHYFASYAAYFLAVRPLNADLVQEYYDQLIKKVEVNVIVNKIKTVTPEDFCNDYGRQVSRSGLK